MTQQVFTLKPPGGVLRPTGLGFNAASVIADNYTDNFVLLPDAGVTLAPWTIRVVVALPPGIVRADARLVPVTHPIPGVDVPQSACFLTWTDEKLPVSSGHLLQQSGVLGLQSVSDPTDFQPIINHQRQILTNIADYEYDEFQIGRLLGRDTFENSTIQWANISGATVATDTAFYLKGTQALKLTTVAGAGNQATARKFFQIPADQAFSTFPLLGVEVWFRFNDANARDVQLFVRPDDSFNRWQPAIRFFNQSAGVAQNRAQYLDSTGNFQDFAVYNVRQGSTNVGDPWHHMMIGLNYLQGLTAPPAYCTYAMAKFDDFTWKPASSSGATWNFNNPPSVHLASNGFREVGVDLIVTGDNASAAAVSWDEFFIVDLSNAFQL